MSGSFVRSTRVATLSIASLFALTSYAHAQEEILGSGWENSSRIVGGKPVESCDFPATLFVKASSSSGASVCTASLVHPQVVMTAAHCLSKKMEIASGDGYLGGNKKTLTWYPVERCVKHPDWNGNSKSGRGKDFAFCKLKSPVKNIKPVPILMGCERDYLKEGTPITLVGFGNTSIGGKDAGTRKHVIDSKVVAFSQYNEVQVGARGAGSLRGDSGGPAYVKLPESKFKKDAGWRVFGVTSVSAGSSGGPDGRAMYGQIHRFVEFVEKQTGIDITPCTDAKGNWDPNKDCKEAPLDPRGASGDWIKGCEPPPYGGYIASCGEPFGKTDEKAPEVSITSPKHKAKFESKTKKIEVKVEATDDGGVASVSLKVNGKSQKADKEAPYEWTLEGLKPGEYKLEVVAEDKAGNKGEGKVVKFTVEEEEPEPGESDSDSDSDSGSGTTDTGSDGDGDSDSDSGSDSDSDSGSDSEKDDSDTKKDESDTEEDESDSDDSDSEGGEDSSGDDDDETEDETTDKKSKAGNKNLSKPGCDVAGGGTFGGWGASLLALPMFLWFRRRRVSKVGQ